MSEMPSCLLIDPSVVQVQGIAIEDHPLTIVLTLAATPTTGLCPQRGQASSRIHSHYQRCLADVSWALAPVRIVFHVRRFFCDTPACPRRIFTERLPTIMQPYARRTSRLAHVQQRLGMLLDGSAGAMVGALAGYPGGTDLLLRLIRRAPIPPRPTPRVLGVDDWALRKGQRYGTILIDHERAQVVDLLPDRTAERLTEWLHDHPGVEIVTRDRADAYAQAISAGAPHALQVADRWHLLKNLTDALTTVLHDHRTAILQQLDPAQAPVPVASEASVPAQFLQPSARMPEAPPTPADTRRQARAATAHHLHGQGWTQKAIAAHLQCHPKTVRRYLQRVLPLSARCHTRSSKLDPYQPYLLERWNAGCHNASQLWRELRLRGYDGGCTILRAFVARLRVQGGVPARARRASSQPLTRAALQRVPSSRELAWLSSQPLSGLNDVQQAWSATLRKVNDTVSTAVQLAQQFATMVRERQAAALEPWLDAVGQCGIKALRSLANGIRADLKAVRAALSVEWSNGRTEGCVNRLKCVKRQMYGRGTLDLLRLRLMSG